MSYSTSPFQPTPTLLMPGKPEYSIGSFTDRIPATEFRVTNSAIASNVATITGSVYSGNIPVAGQLISTVGLTNIPNVTNVAITTVTINAVTGIGTIVYPLTNADVPSAPDYGRAKVPVAITLVSPAATTVALKGIAFAVQAVQGSNARQVAWFSVVSGGSVSAAEFDLQGSVNDIDSEYFLLDKSTQTAGETRSYTPTAQINFLRVVATLTYTGSPLIAAGISL